MSFDCLLERYAISKVQAEAVSIYRHSAQGDLGWFELITTRLEVIIR